ncbi:hypothetical protein [Pseudomonas protegens]|jgi:hypothetical protein|uniref:hypothetical protein n=1 Tax=Pseudomonas protegens TaxID=380021 RepID=UPI00069D6716|nr:hypothetical protein [Pseudomonas protegens]MDK1399109.1 hypothetical protein [Pseudomonas protegens]
MGIGIVGKGAEDFRDCGAIQAASVLDARQYVDIGIFARTHFGAENMGFSTTVWEWYGQDEYKRVLAVGEAQLRPFLEELMVDCGRAVRGVKS